jgi:anti-sigma regulatory factor (Ser/Thr protein kinase)
MQRSFDDEVHLVVPADAQHVRLARLVASGVAAAAGFHVEDVADFRIAVDELCATLLETTQHSVALVFRAHRGVVEVEGRTTGPAPSPPDPLRMDLARQILDVVADGYELDLVDGRAVFKLTKRTAEVESRG